MAGIVFSILISYIIYKEHGFTYMLDKMYMEQI